MQFYFLSIAFYYDDIWTCKVLIGGIDPGIEETRKFTQPVDCTYTNLKWMMIVCEQDLP